MSAKKADSSNDNSSSIYEKFKMNTHKMFNEDAFKDRSEISSKASKKSAKKSRGHEYRTSSQAPIKIKGVLNSEKDHEQSGWNGSHVARHPDLSQNNSKKLKISGNKKGSHSPVKLDKSLKSIENRILQKMKNKRQGKNLLPKMPSIERNQSPTIPLGHEFDNSKLMLGRVHDYNSKSSSKKHKFKDYDDKADLYSGNKVDSIRQTLSSAFQPNDSDSYINKINYVKPIRDSQSEYDLYNSYGSSTGFVSDEKRMSNNMKFKIKQSFRYRDEIETAETDSFFSSKFSKFSPHGPAINKPNKFIMDEMMKRKNVEGDSGTNFPIIKKNVPNKPAAFSLPSLK